MGRVAFISFPDVFDQEDNPTGTQRDLDKKHAEQCFAFAMGSQDIPPEQDPRAFPEVILNARDASVLEFYDLQDPTATFVVDSLSDGADLETQVIGTRVRVDRLDLTPRTSHPQISRVDGNHRLAGVDAWLKDAENNGFGDDSAELELPVVPFALLVALNPEQEARLFRDVNAEHKGMETAHLATLDYRLHDEDDLQRTNSRSGSPCS